MADCVIRGFAADIDYVFRRVGRPIFRLGVGTIAAEPDPENAAHAMNVEVRSIAGDDMARRSRVADK